MDAFANHHQIYEGSYLDVNIWHGEYIRVYQYFCQILILLISKHLKAEYFEHVKGRSS